MTTQSSVRKPRQARSKATVEAILEATAQILRAEGLEGCTTARVAERAGVSVGSLYQYFPNKEALYDALTEQLIGNLQRTRAEILTRELESDQIGPAITALMEELLRYDNDDPLLFQQLHRYEAASGQNRLAAYQLRIGGLVAEQLRQHAALVRPMDADLVARVIVDAVGGVVERMAREEPALLERTDVRQEIAALVAGYLSPMNPVVLNT